MLLLIYTIIIYLHVHFVNSFCIDASVFRNIYNFQQNIYQVREIFRTKTMYGGAAYINSEKLDETTKNWTP